MSDEERRCKVEGCKGPDRKRRLVTRGAVCEACRSRLEQVIADTPGLYMSLSEALEPSQGDGEKVATSKGHPAPLRIDVLDLMCETVAFYVEFADLLARQDRLAKRPWFRMSRHVALAEALTIISPRLDRAGEWPHDVSAAFNLHQSARRTLGLTALIHRLPAPCPECDLMTLVRYDGDDKVTCRACNLSWSESEYRLLVRILTEEARRK